MGRASRCVCPGNSVPVNLALSNVGSGSVERGRCKCPGTQGRVRCETSTTFVTGRLRKRSGHDCYRVLAGGVGAWRSFVRGRTTPRAHKTPRARNSHRERTKPRERGTPRAHNTSTLRALSRLTQRRKPPNTAAAQETAVLETHRFLRAPTQETRTQTHTPRASHAPDAPSPHHGCAVGAGQGGDENEICQNGHFIQV